MEPSPYDYAKPMGAFDDCPDVVRNLAETRAMRRLQSIRFLGAPSYTMQDVLGEDTRYEHSVGVASLAWRYCAKAGLDEGAANVTVAAALLHDAGHPPFSHSAERIFKWHVGMDHHETTRRIVDGRGELGREVAEVLSDHGVDKRAVSDLLFEGRGEASAFFHSPINFDTIEGICRCAKNSRWPGPTDVLDAAISRSVDDDMAAVDAFWARKGAVYGQVIGSLYSVLADTACALHIGANADRIGESDALGTEDAMFEKIPALRKALTVQALRSDEVTIASREPSYTRRIYAINPEGNFFAGDDRRRYVHEKRRCSIVTLIDREQGRKAAAMDVSL